jgi:hypothetical protein
LDDFKIVNTMLALLISLFISFSAPRQTSGEFLYYKTSRLNNSIPNTLSKTALIRFLGKPTKTEPFITECALSEEQENAKVKNWYYYDSTRFFVYDEKAEICEVNFRNGKFSYTTEKIILSRNTSLRDLQKVYPASTKAAIRENNEIIVRIEPCASCDGYCILYFEKDKLVRLEWWEPC